MSETTRRIHTTVLGYFLRGLLLLVPITLMVWAIWQSLAYLDSIIKTDIPGLGLLILLGIIVLTGWLGSTFLYQPIANLGEDLLQRIPFLQHLGVGPEKVAVYLPHAFNWSGNLFIVPKANLTILDARAADVMKFVVSGGVSQVDDEGE